MEAQGTCHANIPQSVSHGRPAQSAALPLEGIEPHQMVLM